MKETMDAGELRAALEAQMLINALLVAELERLRPKPAPMLYEKLEAFAVSLLQQDQPATDDAAAAADDAASVDLFLALKAHLDVWRIGPESADQARALLAALRSKP